MLKIILELGNLLDLHAPSQPPQDGWALVFGEVVARSRPQIGENGAKHIFFGVESLAFLNLLLDRDESGNPLRKAAKGKDIVDASGSDGASRHGRIFGLVRVLNEDQPARLLDRFYPN